MSDSTFKQAQIPLAIGVGDKASFENFWVGHNDEVVKAIASMVSLGEPKLLYFYGASGAGKSHLMFAAMKLAKEDVVNTSYLCLANTQITPEHLAVVDVAHLVCIDDIDAWAGNLTYEQALFTLFEQIKHAGGQMIVSANKPPRELGSALPDLMSRLNSGLVYPLEALTDEQKFEAIRLRATLRGLTITKEVIQYLLSRSSRDTHELFRLLDAIDHASLVEKRRITIPFLQSIL